MVKGHAVRRDAAKHLGDAIHLWRGAKLRSQRGDARVNRKALGPHHVEDRDPLGLKVARVPGGDHRDQDWGGGVSPGCPPRTRPKDGALTRRDTALEHAEHEPHREEDPERGARRVEGEEHCPEDNVDAEVFGQREALSQGTGWDLKDHESLCAAPSGQRKRPKFSLSRRRAHDVERGGDEAVLGIVLREWESHDAAVAQAVLVVELADCGVDETISEAQGIGLFAQWLRRLVAETYSRPAGTEGQHSSRKVKEWSARMRTAARRGRIRRSILRVTAFISASVTSLRS